MHNYNIAVNTDGKCLEWIGQNMFTDRTTGEVRTGSRLSDCVDVYMRKTAEERGAN